MIAFPSCPKSAIEKRSSTNPVTYKNRYPIVVHRDFLLHNMLFDDAYNVMGVIDWEFAHSASLEVFTALTNIYSYFDSKTLHVVIYEEGRKYY